MMNRLKEIRIKNGLTREKLAEMLGTTPTTIYRKETGSRKLNANDLANYAKALNCDASELLGESQTAQTIAISGFVSAFGSVLFTDTRKSTKVPIGMDPEKTSVLLVEQNFPPFNVGWMFFYEGKHPGVPHQYLNELCVVGLKDGQTFIRKILPSEKPGQYNLISIGHNEPEIKYAFVEFSAIINFMKRHEE